MSDTMIKLIDEPNFIEVAFLEEANLIDMKKYRLLEGLTSKKGIYCFIKRQSMKSK